MTSKTPFNLPKEFIEEFRKVKIGLILRLILLCVLPQGGFLLTCLFWLVALSTAFSLFDYLTFVYLCCKAAYKEITDILKSEMRDKDD